jgi:hypothetical protein
MIAFMADSDHRLRNRDWTIYLLRRILKKRREVLFDSRLKAVEF